jgi:hypothetical protein
MFRPLENIINLHVHKDPVPTYDAYWKVRLQDEVVYRFCSDANIYILVQTYRLMSTVPSNVGEGALNFIQNR